MKCKTTEKVGVEMTYKKSKQYIVGIICVVLFLCMTPNSCV